MNVVKCSKCPEVFEVKATVRESVPMQMAEVGLECPACHYFLRSYWTTPALEQKRGNLAKKAQTITITKDYKLRARMQDDIRAMRHEIRVEHDELQERMKNHDEHPANQP